MLNSVTKKVAEDDIQLKLNKTATRKNLITKVLPFTGLIFLILLFSLTTDGKFWMIQTFRCSSISALHLLLFPSGQRLYTPLDQWI